MLTRTSFPVTARGNASPTTRPTQRQALNSGKRKAAAASSTSAFPLPLKCRRASAQAKAAHMCKQTNTLQRIMEISNLKLQRKAGAHRPFRALRDRDRQPGCRSRKSIRLYDSLTDRDSRPDATRPHHIHCHCTLHLAMFSVWRLFSANTCECVCVSVSLTRMRLLCIFALPAHWHRIGAFTRQHSTRALQSPMPTISESYITYIRTWPS
jgi:hypothetical protein